MCGIAGIVDLEGRRTIDRDRLQLMSELIAHRGPDGEGFAVQPGYGFAHRRLAIVDLCTGQQPMRNEDGSIVTVYNGEIYNFAEVRDSLEKRGHHFKSRSDTEVIVHGYEEWGSACLERFRGMFAFALWDEREQTLFLARDRLGEKPLYWTVTEDGFLLFASELRAVAGALDKPLELDPAAVADYFAFGYVPDPKSIFRGIEKLAPGHYLAVRRHADPTVKPVRYWRPRPGAITARGEAELAEELIERLEECVRIRTIADVPLGAFLSGGVDSSAIVAMLARSSSLPVTTCTIGFDDPALDETAHAEVVARHFATDHEAHRVSLDASALLDKLSVAYGEPFADSSALPSYVVSAQARKRVTVALSGDGGDELFLGYRRYPFYSREEQVKALLPSGLRHGLLGPLARRWPRLDNAPRVFRAKATLEALASDSAHGYLRSITPLPDIERRSLFTPAMRDLLGDYDPAQVLSTHFAEADLEDPLGRAQYADLLTWLPGRMLVKVDRASMANGLEVRPPLLDHEFVEWSLGIPHGLKLKGFDGKRLFKKALEPFLPPQFLNRPKQGFSLPLAQWLRTCLAPRLHAMCDEGRLSGTGLFNPTALRDLVQNHISGRFDHGQALWALLMFDGFLLQRWQESSHAPARLAAVA
jgi:asparagine synthase (glutamine-hydrolysing)